MDSRRFLRELDEASGGNNLQYILKCPCIPFFGNQGSPYIYLPSKITASRSNGSRIENGIEVGLADVFWGGWVLLIVLRDEVRCLDIGGYLPRVVFFAKTLLLDQELEPPPVPATINISSTSHSSSPSTMIGGSGACSFLPRIRSSGAVDNFTMLNTGCNCLIP